MAELSGIVASGSIVDDVSLCRRRYQRRQIQNVEDIEEVCPNFQLGPFSEERRMGQRERFSKCHIH